MWSLGGEKCKEMRTEIRSVQRAWMNMEGVLKKHGGNQ